jgi:TolA-binding protein
MMDKNTHRFEFRVIKAIYFIIALLSIYPNSLIAKEEQVLPKERLLSDAKVYFKQSDFSLCIKNLNDIITFYSQSPEAEEAHFMLGDCYFPDIEQFQDLHKAAQAYQEAIDMYLESKFREDALFKLALTYEKLGDLMQASLTYGALLKDYPNSPEEQFAIQKAAELEYTLENPKEAVTWFSALVKKFPDSPEIEKAYYRIGDCFFVMDEYASALEYYNIALEKFPIYINEHPNLLFRISETYFQTDNFDKAREYFMKITNYFPQNESSPEALMRIGDCLFFKEDYKRALFFFNEVITRFPDSKVSNLSKIKKIELEIKMNPLKKYDLDFLMEILNKIDPLDPQFGVIYFRLAEIYYINGYSDGAYEIVVKAIETGVGKNVEAKCFELKTKILFTILKKFTNEKNYEKVIEYFVKDNEKFLTDQYSSKVYFLVAYSLFEVGNYSDAKNYMIKIPETDQTKSEYIWLLIRIYDALGDYKNIIMSGEKFLKTYPLDEKISKVNFILTSAYYESKDYKKAIEIYQDIFKKSPDLHDPKGYYFLGMSFYKVGNFKDALDILKKAGSYLENSNKDKNLIDQGMSKNITEAIDGVALAIADSQFNLSNYNDSLKLYMEFLLKYPKSEKIPYALYQVGSTYLKLNNKEKAKENFDKLVNQYKGSFWAEQAQVALTTMTIESINGKEL